MILTIHIKVIKNPRNDHGEKHFLPVKSSSLAISDGIVIENILSQSHKVTVISLHSLSLSLIRHFVILVNLIPIPSFSLLS